MRQMLTNEMEITINQYENSWILKVKCKSFYPLEREEGVQPQASIHAFKAFSSSFWIFISIYRKIILYAKIRYK